MLQWKLQENRLSFLEQRLKHSHASTYRSLGYLNDDMIYHVCEGLPVGTVSRFRHLRNEAWSEAAAVEELPLQNIDFTDAEPECISRKLAARLEGHSIECLSGVLASCDILSYEWLGRLSPEEIAEVRRFALVQGIDVDDEMTARLVALCYEAEYETTTRCTQAFEGVSTNWQRVVLTQIAKCEVERARQFLADLEATSKVSWPVSFSFWKADHPWLDLGACHEALNKCRCICEQSKNGDRTDLQMAWNAFANMRVLAHSAKLGDWSCSVIGSCIRAAVPTLRDLVAWRAVDLVGYTDHGGKGRERYLNALNRVSHGRVQGLGREGDLQSQVLMTYETLMSKYPGSWESNSSVDGRRRGKKRPNRKKRQGREGQARDRDDSESDVEVEVHCSDCGGGWGDIACVCRGH